jgi:hypothetical protein
LLHLDTGQPRMSSRRAPLNLRGLSVQAVYIIGRINMADEKAREHVPVRHHPATARVHALTEGFALPRATYAGLGQRRAPRALTPITPPPALATLRVSIVMNVAGPRRVTLRPKARWNAR